MTERTPGSFPLGGRFRLIRKIGEGGMGVVWEALEVARQRRCAVKFLRPESDDVAARRRFVREADVLRAMSHRNIVTTYEIGTDDDGTPAIVMELLEGESLAQRLGRVRYLSIGQTSAILARVTAAVQAAHASGVVHRDLKPDNVFLCVDPNGVTDIRVLDFGVAKKFEAAPDKLTETGTLVGTPYYMSPEQAAGERGIDARTDTWAMSVIAFECITGEMPVSGENYGQLLSQLIRHQVKKLAAVRPDLPADFVAAIDAGLVEREHRPSLDRLAIALSARADPSIASPPKSVAAETRSSGWGKTLPDAPTLSASVVAPTVTEVPRLPKGVVYALLGFALVAMATLAAGLFVRSRHHASTAQVTSALPIDEPATTSASAAPSEPASATEPVAAPPATSASPPPSAPTPKASPAAARASTSGVKPARPHASSAASGISGRLQGGVGGDVPF